MSIMPMLALIALIIALPVALLVASSIHSERHVLTDGEELLLVSHLPNAYQGVALREAAVTRDAGIRLTVREMRRIVEVVERMAVEHGAMG